MALTAYLLMAQHFSSVERTLMKIAVVLYSLGGPDSLTAVKPFLRNLFSDKAIIGLPALFRLPLAALISSRREEEAKHIYAAIGGASPLLKNTKEQAKALEDLLNSGSAVAVAPQGAEQSRQITYKTFIIMRYWHPRSEETMKEIKAFAPDKIVELPLYPQFSTTTTQSSFDDFASAFTGTQSEWRNTQSWKKICCYPVLSGFIAAQADLIKPIYEQVAKEAMAKGCTRSPRILFSAHGLPEKTIRGGDPYQTQCEMTVEAIVRELGIANLDYRNTYQSRVGPLKWIGPYTDAEIERGGQEGVPLLVVPIAFVSEHSETLYEIEQQYRALAAEKGVPVFARVPAVGTHPAFIKGLAGLVHEALAGSPRTAPAGGQRICPSTFKRCACQ